MHFEDQRCVVLLLNSWRYFPLLSSLSGSLVTPGSRKKTFRNLVVTGVDPQVQWAYPELADIAGALSCLLHSSGPRSLEEVCLQVTDLLPGLRKLRNLLPEHGCLLLSPGNFWQNDRERFHADPDIIRTIHQHEPKTLQTSATLKGSPVMGSYKGCQLSPGGTPPMRGSCFLRG